MTKKDFEAIAKVIQRHGIKEKNPLFVWDLMDLFKESNPLFNPVKFLEACRHHEK